MHGVGAGCMGWVQEVDAGDGYLWWVHRWVLEVCGGVRSRCLRWGHGMGERVGAGGGEEVPA